MKELKAPDKVVQKMTRDGAVAENLATGETESISGRDPETTSPAARNPLPRLRLRRAYRPDRSPAIRKEAGKGGGGNHPGRIGGKAAPPYRLQFTDEERADPAFQKYIRHSDKAANKLDAAKEAIPTRKVLKTERVFDEAAGRGKTRLAFEEVEKRPNGKLRRTLFPVLFRRSALLHTTRSTRWSRKMWVWRRAIRVRNWRSAARPMPGVRPGPPSVTTA